MAFWKVSVDDTMNGRVGRGGRHPGRRADVHAHDGVGLLAGLEERVPVAGVDRRQPQRVGVLGEGHGVAAPGGARPDLGGGQLGVPQRDHRERDEPALAVAGAPLVDHPVVVGLDAGQREVGVAALSLDPLLVERLAAEAGERVGEADRRLDVVGVHVGQPVLLDPAAAADLVEGGRGDVEVVEARPRPTASGRGRPGRRTATSRTSRRRGRPSRS